VGELKPGWKRVKFGDVVRQVKDKVDPTTAGVARFVAGEHMDTDDLRIRLWGEVNPQSLGPAFHMRFRPGQVLYGSRRTYLRKVALADFEGICANTTFILESADPKVLLPDLLPFLMQTEGFHEHSKRESKGSVNPYVNFSDLAWYEFALPPLKEQERLRNLFGAVEQLRTNLVGAESASRQLFRAAVDSLYSGTTGPGAGRERVRTGIGALPKHWVPRPLVEVCSIIRDGVHKRPKYVDRGIPFITVENLTRGPRLDLTTSRYVTAKDHAVFTSRAKPEFGDVLLSKDGATLGVARIVDVHEEFSIFVSVALLKPIREVLDGYFLRFFFESGFFRRLLASKVSGSALPHIHLVDIRGTLIPMPPIHEQREIGDLLQGVEGASRAIQAQAVKHRDLQKHLYDRVFCDEVG